MLHKIFAAMAAAAIVTTTVAVSPADAARKERQYRSNTTSLDGRNTGRPRTCGHDSYVYDSRGVPMGPYCH
jgi:hypothetical protein